MIQITFIHIEGTISSINDWMSANFLSLNPDKTEFLLIGHPEQLSELDQFFNLLHCVLFACYIKLFNHFLCNC